MDKKILIVTMDCFSKYNSATTANTFETLFKNYNPKNLASLYLREEVPSGHACSKYFQISENAVIKSVIKRKIKTGKLFESDNVELTSEDQKNIQKTKERYKKHGTKRNWFLLFVREFLWKIGKWKSKELGEFLDEFKPDIIIYGMEGYGYFHRIVRYALKKTGAKGVGYFWDDNFTFVQRAKTPSFLLHRSMQRSALKKTSKLTQAYFAISEKTKREADEFFKINSTVITKPVDIYPFTPPSFSGDKVKIVYTGNLKIGRFDSLKLISKVLDENKEFENKVSIDVYSSTFIPDNELKKLNGAINFKGAVPSNEIFDIQKSADVLLLLEDVLGKHKKIARLSFSTKVTDYLGQGKVILSIGLNDLASSEYLKANSCAMIAENESEIKKVFIEIIGNRENLLTYASNAHSVAVKNHSREIIESRFYDKLESL